MKIYTSYSILDSMNYKSIYTSPRFDDEDEEKKQKAPDPFTDRFLKTRQIVLTGEVNKELADSIAKQLLILCCYAIWRRNHLVSSHLHLCLFTC